MAANGNPLIRTPNLDALARDGVSFAHSYVNAVACMPSRACLMSGQHANAHGVLRTCRGPWLQPSTPTLPGCFSAAGYQTVGVGKMHFQPWHVLGGFDRRVFTESKYDGTGGQDEYRQTLKALGLHNKNIGHHTPGFGKAFKTMPTTELPPDLHIDAFIGRRGAETLEQLAGRGGPFFLMVSFCGPHEPWDPPPPYDTMYDLGAMPTGWSRKGELDILPARVLKGITDMGIEHLNLTAVPDAKKREITAYYYGNVTLIDHWVGRILDALKRRGLYDDTVIVFTSDHGEYLGDHNTYYKADFPCDSDCRVPLILKAPGARPGARPERIVGNVDIMPALLDLAGIRVPESCQGRNLLTAEPGSTPESECAITYSESGPSYRVRTRDWAYVRWAGGSPETLYHVAEDPHELNNLAGDTALAEQKRFMRDLLFRLPRRLTPDT